MFEITDNFGYAHPYDLVKFSGGELQPKFNVSLFKRVGKGHLFIKAGLFSSDDIMELCLVVNAIRDVYVGMHIPIDLICPYFPYARQDRHCSLGEANGAQVMAGIINSLNFNSVTLWDAHSDVSSSLLHDSINVPQHSFYVTKREVNCAVTKNAVLVSPDTGAVHKAFDGARLMGIPMICANKVRDLTDGKIVRTEVLSPHVGDKNFFIPDDICDGGATYIALAKELKKLTTGKIYLYVTHLIASKGLDVFAGLIDHIYTANAFPNVYRTHPLVTVL